jgi:hypothetical protein
MFSFRFGLGLAGFREQLRRDIHDAEDVVLAHDDVLGAFQFDLVAGVFAE